MPRSKQFGYLFTKTALQLGDKAIYRTIAHEIAHGAFHLNHTFDSNYQIAEGTTNNLMDYTSGTDLVKHQWDAIHDPGLVVGMFEKDEEGAMKIIPEFWWRSGLVDPGTAGFIDDAWELIESLYGVGKFALAWKSPYSNSEDAIRIRQETVSFMNFLKELYQNSKQREELINAIKLSIIEYAYETTDVTSQAKYNQGKLIFNVATLFVGIGEINSTLKGEKVTISLIELLRNLPKNITGILSKAKSIGHLIKNVGKDIVIYSSENGSEIGRVVNSKFLLKYSGFGGDIVAHDTKATTILGKFLKDQPNGTDALIKTGLTNSGVPGKEIGQGVINVLYDPEFGGWATNKAWLDAAISRKDIIRLVFDPKDATGFYKEEIDYLLSKGYRFEGAYMLK